MKQCFIISPIGEESSLVRKHADDVYEYIIQPAMAECGVTAFRSDHLDKPGKISDQMFHAIYTADMCIAILTGYNPNVFYELAVAQSANRPVIILIEKGQLLPFDIKDLRCIYYDLEIRSYKEQAYIKRIINYVREFEVANWVAIDLFTAHRPQQNASADAMEFFESSGEYGTESNWLSLLQNAESSFDIMGISLTSWRRTRDLRTMLHEKSNAGCKVRILLMSVENPILDSLIYSSTEMSAETVKREIEQSFSFYKSITQESTNVEVRLMQHGIPHFFLTLTDKKAVIILYLSSQTWGAGPLWRCLPLSKLYNVALREFNTLWEWNSSDPKPA